jgi:tetratricopeptide (TPR) repeat protein/transglutaminase-like putative cysteine protease
LLAAAVVLGGGPSGSRAAPAAPAPYAWDARFLTGPPKELLAAAKSATDPSASTIVLFEERVDTIAPDGRVQFRDRRAYKILTEAAVSESDMEAGWAPWHETQPEIRARVVTRDGRVYTLDPKTIEISGSGGSDPDVFSDRRHVRAPLPGIAVGAVVEEEVTWESRPIIAGLGSASTFYFGEFVPVLASRLVVDAPRAQAIHMGERGPGIRMTRTEKGDRVRIVYEAGPTAAAEVPDEGWPDDVPIVPSVRYTTGPTWREIAARYSEIIDKQIAGADLGAWVKEARAAARGSRQELIVQLLARLHREVRYTGVEFGDASIVPRQPAEVLARGYGDCKDKAAFLVALLRAAGVPAHVALLRVTGLDVDPKLPTFDGFDHAIVYVPAAGKAPALWIDATNPYAAVGELPAGDVERRLLVATPRTDALVIAPAALAGTSRVKETRRILLGESGHPRIIERTEAQGGAARAFRQLWSTTPRKELEEEFTSYVKEQYLAKALTRLDIGSPADLTKPVLLELEASDAEIGNAWDEGAQVLTRAGQTLIRLPSALRSDSDDATATKRPRAVDYVIQERYAYELRYEVVPPHGYVADTLPVGATRAIGTSTLRSSFSLDPKGVVIVNFTFDSGKPRLTPAEFQRFRADIKEFWKSSATTIGFHSAGAAALGAGKVRDALAIFRTLDAEHPRQSVHARQIAEAVLQAGLGQVARDEAKRALAADPKSVDGERVLGWTLEHDLVGRRFGAGADLAGAEQAYRRALALDPKNVAARASLAILLEHDGTGHHSYPAARLPEAVRLYEGIEKDGDKTFAINHTLALLHQERFKAVIDRTQSVSATNEQSALLAALAATQGAPAALREAASRLVGNAQRAEVLRLAGAELLGLRRYPEASAFYEEAAREHSSGAAMRVFAARLRRARRYETVKPDLRQPTDVARAAFIEVFRADAEHRQPNKTALAALATREFADALAKDPPGSGTRGLTHTARAMGGIPLIAVADSFAGATFEAEGRAGVGWRVKMTSSDLGVRMMRVLLRAAPEGPRVVSISENRVAMAREVLRLHRDGRLDAARTWLDWLLEDELLGTPTDPLSGSLLARVWSEDDSNRSARAVETGAAIVMASMSATKDEVAPAIPILQRALAASLPGAERDACAIALVLALRTADQPGAAEPITADLLKRWPQSPRALELRVRTLIALKRAAEALRVAEAEAKAYPDDLEIVRVLGNVQLAVGKLTDALPIWVRIAASTNALAGDHNNLAWARLCLGDAGDSTLASARRSVDMSNRRDATALHTLAAVLAERGEPEQAREALIESLDHRGTEGLGDHDRYVLARLAESHAFLDIARDLYRQIKRPEGGTGGSESSSYALAQRRLARIAAGATAGAAPAATTTKPAR